jgi:hypothetical protein
MQPIEDSACKHNDGSESSNSSGLRSRYWDIADIDQLALAGHYNGRLNMNCASWETSVHNLSMGQAYFGYFRMSRKKKSGVELHLTFPHSA